jgi:alanyl-tRNA synthetase
MVETRIMALDDAKASGAMALFGEKYDEQVRVLRMGDFSTELCGGTHVKALGDIGLFKITMETGIASGIRRVEAVTGERAVQWIEADEDRLLRLGGLVNAGRDELEDKIGKLIDRNRKLEKELEQIKSKLASAAGSDLASQAVDVGAAKVLAARLDGVEPKSLRDTLDQLKNKLGTAVILLAAVNGEKVNLIAGVTKDLTDRCRAGDLVKLAAEQVGGKGGGRPDMAQAGGSDPGGVPKALDLVKDWVAERL